MIFTTLPRSHSSRRQARREEKICQSPLSVRRIHGVCSVYYHSVATGQRTPQSALVDALFPWPGRSSLLPLTPRNGSIERGNSRGACGDLLCQRLLLHHGCDTASSTWPGIVGQESGVSVSARALICFALPPNRRTDLTHALLPAEACFLRTRLPNTRHGRRFRTFAVRH